MSNPPPFPPPSHPYGYGQAPLRTGSNGLAIAGFVLSFLGGCLGLIFSIIGLNESKKYVNRSGRGLAIAGICISGVWLLIIAASVVAATMSGADRDDHGTIVDAVPCTEEHYDAFETFVGIAADDSGLDYEYYVPAQDSWDQGDRAVLCTVVGPSSRTTQSLQGAGR